MKTNELRIGNYVMYADVICKVEGYSRGFLETDGVNSLISKFQPIPIDEKWLTNFGFKEVYNSEFTHKFELIKNESFEYRFEKFNNASGMNGISFYGRLIKKVYFIHELQNLYFALIGEELEYKKQKL